VGSDQCSVGSSRGPDGSVRKTARTYTTVGDLISLLQRCDPDKLVQLNGHPLYDNPISIEPEYWPMGRAGIRGLSVNIIDERDGSEDCHCDEYEVCMGGGA